MSFKNRPIIITDTYANISSLKSASKLVPGATYNLSDRDIWINALTENTFELEGKRMQWVVKDTFYTPQSVVTVNTVEYIGIYGQAIAAGTVPVSTSGLGGTIYRAIWGGQLWQRKTTGTDGAPTDDVTLLSTAWDLVTPTTATNDWRSFEIIYYFDNDLVKQQSDWKGNVLINITGLDLKYSDWGNVDIHHNRCGVILNNYKYSSNKALISYNSNNGYIYGNSNNGAITYNSNNGYIVFNSNNGTIYSNSNSGEIWDNSNNGPIYSNSNNGYIYGNSNNGTIYSNSNSGGITNNSSTGVTTFSIYANSNNGYISHINSTANISIENVNIPFHIGHSSATMSRSESLTGKYVVNNTLTVANTNSSSTVYNTVWSFTAIAGETYKMEMIGTYQTGVTTTGIKIKLGGTAVCNVAGKLYGGISSSAVATELSIPASSMTSELITTGVSVINTPHFIGGDVIFRCTTGGTILITMASEVNTSAVQLNIGSTCMIERIV